MPTVKCWGGLSAHDVALFFLFFQPLMTSIHVVPFDVAPFQFKQIAENRVG